MTPSTTGHSKGSCVAAAAMRQMDDCGSSGTADCDVATANSARRAVTVSDAALSAGIPIEAVKRDAEEEVSAGEMAVTLPAAWTRPSRAFTAVNAEPAMPRSDPNVPGARSNTGSTKAASTAEMRLEMAV